MGVNISGIVIDVKDITKMESVFQRWKWKVKKIEEVSFKIASSNDKHGDYCDVYFTDEGALLFLNSDRGLDPYKISGHQVLTFSMSPSNLDFSLYFSENGFVNRSIVVTDGERVVDEGDPLELESVRSDIEELIWLQMEELLDRKFNEIAWEEPVLRYEFLSEEEVKELEVSNPLKKEVLSSQAQNSTAVKKTWWKWW